MYFDHHGLNIRNALCATVIVAATLSASQLVFAQTADIVFTNADVRTMDEANPRAQAVAVTGKTIIDLEAVIKTVCGMDAAVELMGTY